jgi:cell division initiation protein
MLFKTDESTETALTTLPSAMPADVRRLPAPERHLTVTPIDMRQTRFATSLRGFDKNEVTAFLDEAANDYETALRENERLHGEIIRLEASLEQFKQLENSLKSTLISAQRVSDDMREHAQKESAQIVRDAEGEALLIRGKAQLRLEEMERDVENMRMKRREAEVSIEATIATLQNSLDFVRNQERRDRDSSTQSGNGNKPVVALVQRPHAVATA